MIHWAPIASVGNVLCAYCQPLTLQNGAKLPSIKLPIPQDPAAIIKSRRSGSRYDDPCLNYEHFLNALKDPEAAPDGLEYAHVTLGNLAVLSMRMSEKSPVEPKMPHFTVVDGVAIET